MRRVSLLMAVAACAAPQVPAVPPAPPPPPPVAQWDCSGNLVPPTGYEQETGFAADGQPAEAAAARARQSLLSRLCGAGACEDLAARVTTWRTGAGTGQVCAMVVVDRSDVEAFRQGLTLERLQDGLSRAASEILAGGKPRVAVDRIVDEGVPGGQRAEWLRRRMEQALIAAGATVIDRPRGEGDAMPRGRGAALPRNLDALVSAITTARMEKQVPVVEVIWEASVAGGTRRVASPVIFPARAAPPLASPETPLPAGDEELSLRLDARSGGSLCQGERTQLWLRSSRAAHVRVFDLYGASGALLLFPPQGESGRVDAGRVIPLGGPGGFEAQPAPGTDAERFLVVAADQPAGLGDLARYTGVCRLPSGIAAALHRGEGLPAGARVASEGFRILTGGDCPPPTAPPAGSVDDLPECR